MKDFLDEERNDGLDDGTKKDDEGNHSFSQMDAGWGNHATPVEPTEDTVSEGRENNVPDPASAGVPEDGVAAAGHDENQAYEGGTYTYTYANADEGAAAPDKGESGTVTPDDTQSTDLPSSGPAVDPPYFNNLNRNRDTTPSRDMTQHTSGAVQGMYQAPRTDGSGQISYMPATTSRRGREKKQKGGMTAAGVALLCVFCILLSTGFGFLGATLSDSRRGEPTQGGTSNKGGPVVYRTAQTVKESADGSSLTYAEVESLVGNSIVEVTTEYTQKSGWYQYVTQGAGSGVIMSEDGYIITNHHVISGVDSTDPANSITVRLKDGTEYGATLVGSDTDADIALLKIEATDLKPAIFADSNTLVVGEEVIAIGNPLGELSGTVTNGIVSALAREVEVEGVTMSLLQTNAAINPGNSGGGLFNMNGELVGIVNAKSSGTDIEGLGFAIPANDALETAEQLLEFGYVKGRPKIGISLYDITDAATARYYGVSAFGVYIVEVQEGYNDDVLEAGDRILAVNDTEITSGDDVMAIVKNASVGDMLHFTLYRGGRLMTVDVKCFESGANSSEVEFEGD